MNERELFWKKTGGPAFPHAYDGETPGSVVTHHGLTRRDWYAGQALPGIMHFWVQVKTKTEINDPDPATVARMAYEYADAMLEASKEHK